MRLLLDQMLDTVVADDLRLHGHDVICVSELGLSESDDKRILEKAIETGRILVTLDGHFGDWAILPLSKHPGVIRVKATPTASRAIIAVIGPFIRQCQDKDFSDNLVIVSDRGSRWIRTSL